MRRLLLLSVTLASVAASAVLHIGQASANPSILVDTATGRVIESDDPFQRWYPASLTKLMTTYVVFRAIQAGEITFSSPVTISKKAAKLPPSKMGYPVGSQLTVDNAIKIIMVKSANDVAASIGESVAGSREAFAARMNAESKRLGMDDSHWVNQHGLHDDAQYTSARDLAILASALRSEFPQYHDYFSIEGLVSAGKEIPSHNNLLARYGGADGMKTGYTCPAGYNLVASATRNGRTMMAVVVGGKSVEARDEKAADLLSRGFASCPRYWTDDRPADPCHHRRAERTDQHDRPALLEEGPCRQGQEVEGISGGDKGGQSRNADLLGQTDAPTQSRADPAGRRGRPRAGGRRRGASCGRAGLCRRTDPDLAAGYAGSGPAHGRSGRHGGGSVGLF